TVSCCASGQLSSPSFPTRRSSDLLSHRLVIIRRSGDSTGRPRRASGAAATSSAMASHQTGRRRRAAFGAAGGRGGGGASGTSVEIGRAPSELQSPDHLVCRLLLEK